MALSRITTPVNDEVRERHIAHFETDNMFLSDCSNNKTHFLIKLKVHVKETDMFSTSYACFT